MTHYPLPLHHSSPPHFSLVSILAIVAAVASFFVAGWGAALFLAIAAIVLGILGAVVALLPGTRGGIMSVMAVLAGLVGIVAAIVRLVL